MALIMAVQYMCRYLLKTAVSLLVQKPMEIYYIKKNITFKAYCEVEGHINLTALYEDKRGPLTYKWSSHTLRSVSMTTFMTFSVAHPIGGYLADKYGGKYVVMVSLLGTSLLSLFQPLIILTTDGAIWCLIVVKGVYGFLDGLSIPACTSILAHWIPFKERASLYSVLFSGFLFASALHHSTTDNIVLATKDWTVPFYIYGALGLVVCGVWGALAASTPHHSLFITSMERTYLDEEMENFVDHTRKAVPLKYIFSSIDFWIFTIGMSGHIWVWNSSLMMLRTYMKDVINLPAEQTKMFQTIPPCMMALSSFIFALLSDWALNNNYTNLTTLRKTFTNLGVLGCPIYMITASFAECDATLVEILFIIALSLQGCSICGIRLVAIDLSPNYAGSLTGLSSAVGSGGAMILGHFLIPINARRTLSEYRQIFYYLLIICASTTLIFAVFGRTYLEPWNKPAKKLKGKKQ